MKKILGIALFLAGSCVNAITIDFDAGDFTAFSDVSGVGGSAEIDGYSFSSTSPASFTSYISTTAEPGALGYCGGCSLAIQNTDGFAFSLESFDFLLGLFPESVTVVGTQNDGGTLTTTAFSNGGFVGQTFGSEWTNLISVEIGAGDSSIAHAIDNLVVNTIVPIPAAVWFFASALGVLGWLRRTQ